MAVEWQHRTPSVGARHPPLPLTCSVGSLFPTQVPRPSRAPLAWWHVNRESLLRLTHVVSSSPQVGTPRGTLQGGRRDPVTPGAAWGSESEGLSSLPRTHGREEGVRREGGDHLVFLRPGPTSGEKRCHARSTGQCKTPGLPPSATPSPLVRETQDLSLLDPVRGPPGPAPKRLCVL